MRQFISSVDRRGDAYMSAAKYIVSPEWFHISDSMSIEDQLYHLRIGSSTGEGIRAFYRKQEKEYYRNHRQDGASNFKGWYRFKFIERSCYIAFACWTVWWLVVH
jgi:hypothetical protein